MVYYDKLEDCEPTIQKEYWVNVYEGMQPFHCHKSLSIAEANKYMNETTYDVAIYRIHVKLKPVKSHKPKYEGSKYLENYCKGLG